MARMFSEEQIAMANSVDIASFLQMQPRFLQRYRRYPSFLPEICGASPDKRRPDHQQRYPRL